MGVNTPVDERLERALKLHQLGIAAESRGRLDEARGHFEACLEVAPKYGPALSALVSMPEYEPSEALMARAMERAARDNQRGPAGFRLCFALARRFEWRQQFDLAFKYMEMANRRRARTTRYEHQRVDETFARYHAVFTRAFVRRHAKHGSASERPLFLFGLPHTGATLIELILSRHPDVATAGGLPDLPRIATRLPAVMSAELKTPQAEFPSCLENLQRIFVRAMTGDYEQALARCSSQAARVIDRNPFNFMYAGLIGILFPRARIIHCRRTPLDVGIACFGASFELSQDFTTDFGNFAHYYGHYHRLMQHWRDELDIPMLDVHYERLVTDPEVTAREIVGFCGLAWDESCKPQPPQPIHVSSVQRWRNYAKQLEPLESALRAQGIT